MHIRYPSLLLVPRYMPILPTVLVNGAEGIGTGWSTSIPNFNPHDIVKNIKRLMNGEEQVSVLTLNPYTIIVEVH